jgi:hypothetical protein
MREGPATFCRMGRGELTLRHTARAKLVGQAITKSSGDISAVYSLRGVCKSPQNNIAVLLRFATPATISAPVLRYIG